MASIYPQLFLIERLEISFSSMQKNVSVHHECFQMSDGDVVIKKYERN